MATPQMKTRRVALILLILIGVFFLGEVRLDNGSPQSKRQQRIDPVERRPSTPMKFVDPPMPAVPPAPTRGERDRSPR
jgi:hypothetical protein